MCALNDLVRAGMVRYIGASSMWTYQLAAMQNLAERKNWTKFVSMQNHYNLIYREEEREMIKYCNATGVGLIPWAPLASGRLARSPSRPSSSVRASTSSNGSIYAGGDDSTCRILARVEEVAKKRGWPMSYVGLAWLNRRVTAPIIGCSTVDRVDEALEAGGKTLTLDEEHYLEELYSPQPVQGHS
ncbi:Aldo keto reductase 3 [Fusarium albosuccineum]|uniref:Aldo keto reductase 3 n=1 Tax=Fusarium albosuccineum TaxID=1237068 RepID=A0A8H4PGB3_9HYPO|nr:Aldo keto reductase 3 [Fusarium albosuccineum]